MNQDNFNKLVTFALLVYCMVMFFISWLFQRNIDLQGFIILVTPLLSQIIHAVSSNAASKIESNKI